MRWREGSDEEYMATDLGDDGPQEEVDSGDVAGSKSSYSRDTANKPASRLERVDTFHSYVRPKWQPILSEFCVNLTGITQVGVSFRRVSPKGRHTIAEQVGNGQQGTDLPPDVGEARDMDD